MKVRTLSVEGKMTMERRTVECGPKDVPVEPNFMKSAWSLLPEPPLKMNRAQTTQPSRCRGVVRVLGATLACKLPVAR